MVTYCDMKMIATSSQTTGQFFDTIIVASSGKEWIYRPIKVLETVLNHLHVTEIQLTLVLHDTKSSWCTAVSTKVVLQKCKSVRDNADWYYG